MTPYSVMIENVTRSILSIRGKEKIDKKNPEKTWHFSRFFGEHIHNTQKKIKMMICSPIKNIHVSICYL